jgi:hypothetical protein
MALDETFSLPVANHPVEEIQGVLLINGVPCDSEPVDNDGYCRQHCSRGNGEVEVSREGKDGTTNSCTDDGEVPTDTESPVEVSGDTRIDCLVELDLMLIDLSHLLLAPEDLESEKLRVVVFGIRKSLGSEGGTSSPRWMRWRR